MHPPLLYLHLHLILAQTFPHAPSTPPFKLLIPTSLLFSPQHSRLHIGRAFIAWTIQQTNHAHKYTLGCLNWRPAFGSRLKAIDVIFGWVQDRYAEEPGRVDIGMEGDGCLECKCWRKERVVRREDEVCCEISA